MKQTSLEIVYIPRNNMNDSPQACGLLLADAKAREARMLGKRSPISFCLGGGLGDRWSLKTMCLGLKANIVTKFLFLA